MPIAKPCAALIARSLPQVGTFAARDVPPVNGAPSTDAAVVIMVGTKAPPISYFKEPSLLRASLLNSRS